jgi:hypothetical protein
MDCIEFVYQTSNITMSSVSFFIPNQFEFTSFDTKWNIKNMIELVVKWRNDVVTPELIGAFWTDDNIRFVRHFVNDDCTVPNKLFSVITVVRDTHGCTRVVGR